MVNKFRDSQNRQITNGLFIELTKDVSTAIYTLADRNRTVDGVEYRALKSAFLTHGDPNGYYFAIQYFDNYRHFKRIMKNKRIAKVMEEWVEEIELMMQADGLNSLMMHAKGEKGQGSAKWLAEKGWQKKSAGRPTKQSIKDAITKAAKLEDQTDDDYERVVQNK